MIFPFSIAMAAQDCFVSPASVTTALRLGTEDDHTALARGVKKISDLKAAEPAKSPEQELLTRAWVAGALRQRPRVRRTRRVPLATTGPAPGVMPGSGHSPTAFRAVRQ